MVVRVIGTDPTIIKTITCRYCGSILEYTLADVGEERVGSEQFRYIKCPTCSNQVIVRL